VKTVLVYLFSAVVLGGFGGGSVSYLAGRIMLPELHLPVPAYGAFFWTSFWLAVFASIVRFLVEIAKD
jgi:hypothetical protein